MSTPFLPRYQPQSPTPDSPPETPPTIKLTQLPQLKVDPGQDARVLGFDDSPPPFGMPLPDRLTPEGSPDTASDMSTFVTPANSARPSVIAAINEDGERDGRGFRSDVLAAFQEKQSRALDMLRSDSGSSTWSQFEPQHFPVATPPHHALEPAFTPPSRSAFAHLVDNPEVPVSPAADGKKEPSIKPAPIGLGFAVDTASTFQKKLYPDPNIHARGRTQAFTSFPLSKTVREKDASAPAQAKEKFTESVAYWLGLYFMFNLGLTLFNKMVLVSFPFPYTLTGLHALSGCAGCYIALERGAFTPARLTSRENLILAAFSVLYTINIAVSNISLQLVTVPFHQVVRASTPLFTIIISAVLLRSRFTATKLVSLLPVVAGVGFATYGDYYFTAWGLILTLLGTFLAALKTVVTNLIQTGGGGRLKLHPLDLLMRMSPLAFIQCVVYAWYTGELENVRAYGATQMTRRKAFALLINGVIACGLNIVSFTANKKAGALTMTVSANCKQVMTIALAVFLFDLTISFTNGVGIFLTLVGGGWYGYVEYTEKRKRTVKPVRT